VNGLSQEHLRTLLYWMREREAVRLRKEAGEPRPWTEDPILDEWRFCNVDRCDDTVTRWIFANVIAPHRDSPVLWFNLLVSRLVNWPPTLAELGYCDEWRPEHFVQTLAARAARGEKVWTGAYMVPAGPAGVEKPRHLADSFSGIWAERASAPRGGSCADWAAFLARARSAGDFMVNQVVTDMKYAPDLERAPDRGTFFLAGPGTQRGLNRLLGRPLTSKWARADAQAAMLELRREVLAAAPGWAPTLEDLNNLGNALCEFDKYLRVLLGEGTPRARYAQSEDPAEEAAARTARAALGWREETPTAEEVRARPRWRLWLGLPGTSRPPPVVRELRVPDGETRPRFDLDGEARYADEVAGPHEWAPCAPGE
jgi:hypothetical protein